MKGASLKYLTKEGFRNVWVNRLMSLASVSVLMACLVIIGLGSMIFFNINALLDTVESQNVIMVYIKDGTADKELNKLENIAPSPPSIMEKSMLNISFDTPVKEQIISSGSLYGLCKPRRIKFSVDWKHLMISFVSLYLRKSARGSFSE